MDDPDVEEGLVEHGDPAEEDEDEDGNNDREDDEGNGEEEEDAGMRRSTFGAKASYTALSTDENAEMPDEVELDNLSGGKNGTPGGGRRKVSALPLTEVVSSSGDTSASPSPRDLVKKTLHQTARDGDIPALNRIKDDSGYIGKHINELDEKKLTPLHYAARYSHLEMVRQLVRLGAEINKAGDDDMTPLHYAARYSTSKRFSSRSARSPQRKDTVEGDSPDLEEVSDLTDAVLIYLIDHGADVNARDKYKLTALHHAAIRGNKSAAERLLRTEGIEKEPKDVQESTPLHLAATYDHLHIAEVLLDEGADPQCVSNDRTTPLHEACLEGNTGIVTVLLEKSEEKFGRDYSRKLLYALNDDGDTPLHLGVSSGDSELVSKLLEYGAVVNAANGEQLVPLHSAARVGDLQTVKLLVEKKAKLNALDSLQRTPIYLAAMGHHTAVIEYLFEMGADVHLPDVENDTPLMIAAYGGHADVVRLLIKLGARLDELDKDDKTALFHAAEKNKPEVIEAILESPEGKELLSVNDQYDNLPIHVASKMGNVDCMRLLLDAGADIDNKNEDEQTPLHLAAINGRTRAVELILSIDDSAVYDEDEDSNTALHLACTNRRAKVAEVLLKNGADVQNRNLMKWTPLDCAAAVGAYHCAKLLLDYDAPIDAQDRSKTTPLHLAAENGHERMITLLLDAGANITMEDAYGRNLLERAILSRQRNVVRTILARPDWRMAMRTTFTIGDKHGDEVPETPLRLLIRFFPDLAEQVFDQCITKEISPSTGTVADIANPMRRTGNMVRMDFEFIEDAFNYTVDVDPNDKESNEYSDEEYRTKFRYTNVRRVGDNDEVEQQPEPYHSNAKVRMDNHPLMIMAEQNRRDLLRHPLCLALVRFKWNEYGSYVYYLGFFSYLLFLATFTVFISVSPNPAAFPDFYQDDSSCHFDHNSTSPDGPSDPPELSAVQEFSSYITMVLVIILALFELLQAFRSRSRYMQWTNLLDWVVYILAFITVVPISGSGISTLGLSTCWQYQVGAAAIVLAWLNLLGDVRELPHFGIYVIMFLDICKTFLKFVPVLILFLVAFSLGFHQLTNTWLPGESPYETFPTTFVKTLVMTTGEFEFDALFFTPNDKQPYQTLTMTLFVLFVVMMTIIVMNLLVGLAVDDIKGVQDQAVLKRLAMQATRVLDSERLLPVFILRRRFRQFEVIKKKKKQWWNVFTDVVSSRGILSEAKGGNEDVTLQDVVDKQDKMDEDMQRLRSDVRSMAAESEKIREILLAFAERQSGIAEVLDDDHREAWNSP